jgi:hypothetical protein
VIAGERQSPAGSRFVSLRIDLFTSRRSDTAVRRRCLHRTSLNAKRFTAVKTQAQSRMPRQMQQQTQ